MIPPGLLMPAVPRRFRRKFRREHGLLRVETRRRPWWQLGTRYHQAVCGCGWVGFAEVSTGERGRAVTEVGLHIYDVVARYRSGEIRRGGR